MTKIKPLIRSANLAWLAALVEESNGLEVAIKSFSLEFQKCKQDKVEIPELAKLVAEKFQIDT